MPAGALMVIRQADRGMRLICQLLETRDQECHKRRVHVTDPLGVSPSIGGD